MEIYTILMENWVDIAAAFGVLFAIAKAITMATNTKNDDKVINYILKVFNVLALNVGKDKNADETKKEVENE